MLPDQKRQLTCSHLCRLLREARTRQGVSMTTLATKAGLSQQAISYVEREMRVPSVDTLLRMADALGLALDEIIRQAREAAASMPISATSGLPHNQGTKKRSRKKSRKGGEVPEARKPRPQTRNKPLMDAD